MRDVNDSMPPLLAVGPRLNRITNETAYNPPGPEEGYLFWTSWYFHNSNSILSIQDAHGASWRGLMLVSCSSLGKVLVVNPVLAPLADSAVCGKSSFSNAAKGKAR